MKIVENNLNYNPNASLDDVQRSYVYQAMIHFKGNKRQACRALGISYPTLYNLLNRYNLLDQFRQRSKRSV